MTLTRVTCDPDPYHLYPPADSFGPLRSCCRLGMRFIPKTLSCVQLAQQHFPKHPLCSQAFTNCCEFVQQHLDQDQNLVLGRQGQWAEPGTRGSWGAAADPPPLTPRAGR